MENKSKTNKRWMALDFFRGLTIAAMILVNNPGNYKEKYWQLDHAEWHGITFADFIFPVFLFIVGISITLSFSKNISNGISKSNLYKKIIKRTVLLFLFGLFVSLLCYPAWGAFRVAGILQRIAIVYLVCSILFLHTTWKSQLIIGGAILVLYWLLLAFIPVPDLGYPSIEPVNNWVSWIDIHYLPGLLYEGNHDPEGILGTLTAIVSGISGLLVGAVLKTATEEKAMIRRLLGYGVLALLFGIVWGFFFPLNKHLWSSSYVLVTSGSGTIFLALCIWLIDIRLWKTGIQPLIVFGSNAITAFLLSFIFLYIIYPPFFGEGTAFIELFTNYFVNIGFPPKFSSLLWAILYTGLCYIPVHIMYKKKIFLKV